MLPRLNLVLAAVLLGVLAGIAPAEELEGTIFLGPGLRLFLQKDESLFTQMLRAVALVDGEVPVLDLSALQLDREDLFLGADKGLYLASKEVGLVRRVGRWTGPGNIQLDPEVRLQVRYAVQEVFEGGSIPALRVTLGSGPAPTAAPVRAGFELWLAELVRLYVPGAMSRAEEADAGLLLAALLGSIPTSPRPSAEQGENLKRLERWIAARPFDALPAIGVLVREAGRRLRAGFSDQDLRDEERATSRYLVELYGSLASTLAKRE